MRYTNYIAAAAIGITCSTGLAAAQTQPPASAQQTAGQQPTSADAKPTTTIVGCVYREQDVPGRAPNVAEKVGVMEDYILAEIASTSAPAASTAGAVGTSGTQPRFGAMYKLERADDSKLGAMVGKRVEVTGRVDKEAGDASGRTGTAPQTTTADKAIGRDRIDLAEFEVVSIREIDGTCPAKPSDK